MCHVQYTCSSWSYIWAAVKLNIRSVKFPCFSWTQNNFLLPRSKIKISKIQRSSKIKDQRSSKIKSSKIIKDQRSTIIQDQKFKNHQRSSKIITNGISSLAVADQWCRASQRNSPLGKLLQNATHLTFAFPIVILHWGNMFIEKYFVEQPDFSQTLKKECAIRRAEIGFLSILIWQEVFIGSREEKYIKKHKLLFCSKLGTKVSWNQSTSNFIIISSPEVGLGNGQFLQVVEHEKEWNAWPS